MQRLIVEFVNGASVIVGPCRRVYVQDWVLRADIAVNDYTDRMECFPLTNVLFFRTEPE